MLWKKENTGYVLILLAFLLFWIGAQFRAPLIAHHKILVGTERTGGDVFSRSVILILRHDARGAFGLILNSPGDGGPVGKDRITALYSNDAVLPDGSRMDDIGLSHARGQAAADALAKLSPPPVWSAVVAGYAGWGPQQLDRELRRNGWKVIDFDRELVTQTPPEEMWEKARARSDALLR